MRRDPSPRRGRTALWALLGLLALLESVSRLGLVPAFYLPPPTHILATLYDATVSGELARRLRGLVDPVVAAAHPVPKIALLPLLMVFLGIGEASRIISALLGAVSHRIAPWTFAGPAT